MAEYMLETKDLGISFGGLKAAQNVNILAERGLRRTEELTERAQRKNLVRGFHQYSCHGGKTLVAPDAIHGQHSYPKTNVRPSLPQ